MGTKKKPTAPPPEPEDESIQVGLRMDSLPMLAALDKLAKRQRRSRNATINSIIELTLIQEGLWPPPSE